MAKYKMNRDGLELHEIFEKLAVLESHCQTWGIIFTDLKIGPLWVNINTDKSIPASGEELREHLGFEVEDDPLI